MRKKISSAIAIMMVLNTTAGIAKAETTEDLARSGQLSKEIMTGMDSYVEILNTRLGRLTEDQKIIAARSINKSILDLNAEVTSLKVLLE